MGVHLQLLSVVKLAIDRFLSRTIINKHIFRNLPKVRKVPAYESIPVALIDHGGMTSKAEVNYKYCSNHYPEPVTMSRAVQDLHRIILAVS